MRISRRKRIGVAVDMTPMLDVVFQLILFFLVSTTFAVLPGINVNLPSSSTATGTDASGITITVEDNGKIWFNDQESSFSLLDKQLSALETGEIKREEYPVTISADDKVTNGTIVKVFDSLRKNGFSAVSLRTTNKK